MLPWHATERHLVGRSCRFRLYYKVWARYFALRAARSYGESFSGSRWYGVPRLRRFLNARFIGFGALCGCGARRFVGSGVMSGRASGGFRSFRSLMGSALSMSAGYAPLTPLRPEVPGCFGKGGCLRERPDSPASRTRREGYRSASLMFSETSHHLVPGKGRLMREL